MSRWSLYVGLAAVVCGLTLAAGCAGYVTKPIDKTTFIQEVAAHVGSTAKVE